MAVLQGKGPVDLIEVCLQLASNMLVLAGKGDMPTCRKLAESVIADGTAFGKMLPDVCGPGRRYQRAERRRQVPESQVQL